MLILSLSLHVNRRGACTASLLKLIWKRLNDVSEDSLALYLFKYLVFVDGGQSRILSHCQSKLVEEFGFLEVLRDGSLDRIELLI